MRLSRGTRGARVTNSSNQLNVLQFLMFVALTLSFILSYENVAFQFLRLRHFNANRSVNKTKVLHIFSTQGKI